MELVDSTAECAVGRQSLGEELGYLDPLLSFLPSARIKAAFSNPYLPHAISVFKPAAHGLEILNCESK